MNNVLELTDVYKSYGKKEQQVDVLQGISLGITQGSKVVVTGESGSGKTTLLSIVSGLDNLDKGTVTIADTIISHCNESQRARFRLSHIGFIFQHHYLLQDFSAVDNVVIPLLMLGVPKKEATERASVILEKIGLAHRYTHLPTQLSGGECQRVAIARALVHEPLLVLADEPTGALDNKNSKNIRELLSMLVEEHNATLLVATHDNDFLSIADTHYHFTSDGIIQQVL